MDSGSPQTASVTDDSEPGSSNPTQTSLFDWLKSQSSDMWNQIKRDVSEVAQSVDVSEPLTVAKGTATSVYRQFSDAIHSLQIDDAKSAPPPPDPDVSQVEDDRDKSVPFSSIKSSFMGVVSALEKGISELTGGSFSFSAFGASNTGASGDNREACIEAIGADPATYERLPSSQEGILPYSEWRSNFFDEHTFCPRPSTLVFEGEVLPTAAIAATTIYPSPEQLLKESPVIRSHLLRLVDSDSGLTDVNGDGINKADFWSRYYYRVWCLDVLDLRRTRLANINASEVATNATTSLEKDANAWPDLDVEEEEEIKREKMALVAENERISKDKSGKLSNRASDQSATAVIVTRGEAENDVHVKEAKDEDLNRQSPQKSVAAGSRDFEKTEAKCFVEEDANVEVEKENGSDDKSDVDSDWEKWS